MKAEPQAGQNHGIVGGKTTVAEEVAFEVSAVDGVTIGPVAVDSGRSLVTAKYKDSEQGQCDTSKQSRFRLLVTGDASEVFTTGFDKMPLPRQLYTKFCVGEKKLFGSQVPLPSFLHVVDNYFLDACSTASLGKSNVWDFVYNSSLYDRWMYRPVWPSCCSGDDAEHNLKSADIDHFTSQKLMSSDLETSKYSKFMRTWYTFSLRYRRQYHRITSALINLRPSLHIERAAMRFLFVRLAGCASPSHWHRRSYLDEVSEMIQSIQRVAAKSDARFEILGDDYSCEVNVELCPLIKEDLELMNVELLQIVQAIRPSLVPLLDPCVAKGEKMERSEMLPKREGLFECDYDSRYNRASPVGILELNDVADWHYCQYIKPELQDEKWQLGYEMNSNRVPEKDLGLGPFFRGLMIKFFTRWRLLTDRIRFEAKRILDRFSSDDKENSLLVGSLLRLLLRICNLATIVSWEKVKMRRVTRKSWLELADRLDKACEELEDVVYCVPHDSVRVFCFGDLEVILEDVVIMAADSHSVIFESPQFEHPTFSTHVKNLNLVARHMPPVAMLLDVFMRRHPQIWNRLRQSTLTSTKKPGAIKPEDQSKLWAGATLQEGKDLWSLEHWPQWTTVCSEVDPKRGGSPVEEGELSPVEDGEVLSANGEDAVASGAGGMEQSQKPVSLLKSITESGAVSVTRKTSSNKRFNNRRRAREKEKALEVKGELMYKLLSEQPSTSSYTPGNEDAIYGTIRPASPFRPYDAYGEAPSASQRFDFDLAEPSAVLPDSSVPGYGDFYSQAAREYEGQDRTLTQNETAFESVPRSLSQEANEAKPENGASPDVVDADGVASTTTKKKRGRRGRKRSKRNNTDTGNPQLPPVPPFGYGQFYNVLPTQNTVLPSAQPDPSCFVGQQTNVVSWSQNASLPRPPIPAHVLQGPAYPHGMNVPQQGILNSAQSFYAHLPNSVTSLVDLQSSFGVGGTSNLSAANHNSNATVNEGVSLEAVPMDIEKPSEIEDRWEKLRAAIAAAKSKSAQSRANYDKAGSSGVNATERIAPFVVQRRAKPGAAVGKESNEKESNRGRDHAIDETARGRSNARILSPPKSKERRFDDQGRSADYTIDRSSRETSPSRFREPQSLSISRRQERTRLRNRSRRRRRAAEEEKARESAREHERTPTRERGARVRELARGPVTTGELQVLAASSDSFAGIAREILQLRTDVDLIRDRTCISFADEVNVLLDIPQRVFSYHLIDSACRRFRGAAHEADSMAGSVAKTEQRISNLNADLVALRLKSKLQYATACGDPTVILENRLLTRKLAVLADMVGYTTFPTGRHSHTDLRLVAETLSATLASMRSSVKSSSSQRAYDNVILRDLRRKLCSMLGLQLPLPWNDLLTAIGRVCQEMRAEGCRITVTANRCEEAMNALDSRVRSLEAELRAAYGH